MLGGGGGEGRGLRSTLSCQLYFLLQGLVQAERHNMNEVLYSNKDCCEPTHKSSECFDGGWVLNGVQGQGRQHLEDGCQVGLGLLKPAALRYPPTPALLPSHDRTSCSKASESKSG